jgi:hypothetical protein
MKMRSIEGLRAVWVLISHAGMDEGNDHRRRRLVEGLDEVFRINTRTQPGERRAYRIIHLLKEMEPLTEPPLAYRVPPDPA